jgi:hypothetical protein
MLASLATGGDIGISRFWHDMRLIGCYFATAIMDGCDLDHEDLLVCRTERLRSFVQAAEEYM